MKRRTFIKAEALQTEFTILTNDPSITAWGWAVLNQYGKIHDCGCIKTSSEHKKMRIRKGDDTTRRINEINTVLLNKISYWNVKYLLSELPHGSQSASAAVMIGITTGIGQTLADALGLGIEWYSEGDSKRSVLGKRSAEKYEMIAAIKKLYNVPWTGIKYIDEAVADALGVYHVASEQSSTLKLFEKSIV